MFIGLGRGARRASDGNHGDGRSHQRVRRRAGVVVAAGVVATAFGPSAAGAGAPSSQAPFVAAPPVTSVPCPAPADGAVCGTVEVLADRSDPDRGVMNIFFRLYQATNASGVILPRQGGPGPASTAPQFVTRVRALMAPLFNNGRSVLFVDQRGRGGSGAINCPDLQANGMSEAGVIACAGALVDASGVPGSGADLYSSAATADDLEDVRKALAAAGSIPDVPVDLFGQSYGGVDLEAYAARYPQQVRSMVGDSPYSSTSDFFGVLSARAFIGHAVDACGLNSGCSTQRRDVERLVRALRRSPLPGSGIDLTGTARPVVGTELALLHSVLSNQPTPLVAQFGSEFLNQGEIGAAARAYFAGDRKPLLRLLAENADVLVPAGSPFPPTRYSAGSNVATQCADQASAPWTWGSPSAPAQYEAALAALPSSSLDPFSRSAWSDWSTAMALGGRMCLPWPTEPDPVVPSGAPQLTAPVLALSPQLDAGVPAPYVSIWANRFPNVTIVPLKGRGHIPAVRADLCAQSLVRTFIADPTTTLDMSCASTPQILPLATRDFPVLSGQATPAKVDKSAGTDRSWTTDRRRSTVAVAAALDALKRFTMAANPTYTSVGLRGGAVTGTIDENGLVTMTLTGSRFVNDLAVSGTVTWDSMTSALDGSLSLARIDGTQLGTIEVSGTWRLPGQDPLEIRGTLGGRTIALLVPST